MAANRDVHILVLLWLVSSGQVGGDSCSEIYYGHTTGKALSGFNDKNEDGLTADSCMDRCIAETDFVCGSADFEFAAARKRCSWTAESRYTQPAYGVNGNWMYLDPCLGCAVAPTLSDSSRECSWDAASGLKFIGNYTCDENHVFPDGSRWQTIECPCETGTWTSLVDTCDFVTCEEPEDVPHASEDGDHDYGDDVTYTCDEGYEVTSGDIVRTCQHDGSWSGQEPVCTEINECLPDPCVHGVCSDLIGGYSCACDTGYTGSDCDENVVLAGSRPASGHSRQFSFVLHSKNARPTTDLVGVGCTVFTQEDCALKCAENADCWSFSYQPLTGGCILTSTWPAGGATYTTVFERDELLYSMENSVTS